MNDQRPTCWPCSADSSRNAGPSPRSLRNAETGVSQSSTNECVTGIRLWSPWRARASSRLGDTSRTSPTAGNQHLLGVGEAEPAALEQHRQVVEDVGRLLGHALVALLPRGAGDLLGLLLHLLADERRVVEQPHRVRARGALGRPLAQRALQAGQNLVRRGGGVAVVEARALAGVARRTGGVGRGPPPRGGRGVAVVEARALAGVARRTGGLDERQHRVGVAVVAKRLDRLRVARRRALVPQLAARAAPQVQLARLARASHGLLVHVRERQDLAG